MSQLGQTEKNSACANVFRVTPERGHCSIQSACLKGANLRHCTRTRTWGLVEGHADPVLFAPADRTGNVRAVRLKNKVETLGDVVGLGNLERRPRKGHVADQAINQAAGELNRSRHQYGGARDRK